MTLIAAFPHPRVRGVAGPGLGGTSDWRTFGAENTRRVFPSGEVLELDEAFNRQWRSDAHFVAYVLYAADGHVRQQPRITKGALDWIESEGYRLFAQILVADLDNPGHTAWSPELLEQAQQEIETLEAFACGGWYWTAHGRRLVHVLREPVDVRQLEPMLVAWHDELEAQGLRPDRACKDWTRMFRLPWVRRADGAQQEQIADLERLVPRDPPTTVSMVASSSRKRHARTVVGGVDFDASIPVEWRARIAVLGEAVRAIETEWHSLFLALAGALCQRHVSLALVPAIVGAISEATGNDDRTAARITDARSTVQRFLGGEPIAGADQLLVGWPAVATALDQVLGQTEPGRKPALPSAADAAKQLEKAIANAPDGVSVVAAGCGTGKTRATVAVAVQTAKRGRTQKGRARYGAKTVISVPTNLLARQVVESVRAAGGKVLRVFSPASEVDADGKPVCRFADSARSIASGHLSVPYELCDGRGQDPCPYRAECPAASGRSGDEDALIVVGNHGLLGQLVEVAGTAGMRVIDEPPALLETHALNAVDFATVAAHMHAFERPYIEGLKPAVYAFEALLRTMPADVPAQDVEDIVTRETLHAAREVRADAGPRLRWTEVRRAREQSAFASDLARAARCTWIIWLALASGTKWVVRVEHKNGVPTLLFTGPNIDLVAALRIEGRTVLLDASPDTAVLSKVAGYDLTKRATRVHAADGAPIQRTHLQWSGGSRRSLLAPNGTPYFDRLVPALRASLAWAAEDPECKTLGLITMLSVHLAIEAALGLDVDREWRKRGLPMAGLTEAKETLGPIVTRWQGTILLGHYGAVRGLDHWKGVDALITLGDPWPNLGQVRSDIAYLGDAPDIADKRSEWLARIELEQAHGRLRAPHRDRPGRALHIGRLRPEGPGWDSGVEIRALAHGRPPNESSGTVDELRAWIARNANGSIRMAARMLGLTDTAVRRYLTGSRAIPASVATYVRSATETPYTDPIQGVSVALIEATNRIRGFGRGALREVGTSESTNQRLTEDVAE